VANAQVTLLSLWRTLVSAGTASGASTALWLGSSAVVLAVVAAAWRRLPAVAATAPLRWWGTVVLLAVALNVRLYFYDALLLVVPAAGWYLERDRYASRRRWWACGAMLGGAFLALYPVMVDVPGGVLVGGLTAVWAMLEAVDLARLGRGFHVRDEPAPVLRAARPVCERHPLRPPCGPSTARSAP
jgi:hypothetical protein